MILRYSALASALVSVGSLLTTFQLLPTEAFLAAAPARRAPWTTTAGLVVPTYTHASSPPLAMGIFEDFMSGQDSSARAKETEKYLEGLQTRVDRINALEADIEELGDDELTAKTDEFRKRLTAGEDLNGKLLEEAFAVVREASW
jgi:hypothetical protein